MLFSVVKIKSDKTFILIIAAAEGHFNNALHILYDACVPEWL